MNILIDSNRFSGKSEKTEPVEPSKSLNQKIGNKRIKMLQLEEGLLQIPKEKVIRKYHKHLALVGTK